MRQIYLNFFQLFQMKLLQMLLKQFLSERFQFLKDTSELKRQSLTQLKNRIKDCFPLGI